MQTKAGQVELRGSSNYKQQNKTTHYRESLYFVARRGVEAIRA